MVDQSSFEPQRNNNFEIQITGLNTMLEEDVNRSEIKSPFTKTPSDIITLSVYRFSEPSIQISTIEVPYQNNSVKYAGKPSFSDSTLTVNDFIGLDVENILSAWQKLVYNYDTQVVGLAVNYKTTAIVQKFAPDGSSVRQWQLVGCWPSQLNLGELNQDGNAQKTVDMTITYDWCRPLQ